MLGQIVMVPHISFNLEFLNKNIENNKKNIKIIKNLIKNAKKIQKNLIKNWIKYKNSIFKLKTLKTPKNWCFSFFIKIKNCLKNIFYYFC